MSETETQRQHTKVAQEWIKERVPTIGNSWRRSQKRWLMEQLAPLCIAETVKTNGGEFELEDRLAEALEILDYIWYETAPKYAQDYRFQTSNDQTEPDEKQKEKIEAAQHIIWHRRDPRRSFNEGFESDQHFECNRESFRSTVTAYLKRPWLRHPVMDWIFMDAMTTNELCSYGESLKQKFIPGKKDWLGMHPQYFQAKGNIEKMKKINWNEYWESLFTKLFWAIGAPVAAIWAAFHYQWETTGIVILSIYTLVVAVYLGIKCWRLVKRIIRALMGKPDPRLAPFQLWENMYQVWQGLEGPVINPTVLREKMQKTTDKGAVWDAPSWALIDRIIMHDPAVWIVEQSN